MAATINRRRRIVRCIVGVAVCLLGVLAGACGMPLVGAATLIVVGIIIVVGGDRRIFRAGVTRTSDAVLCRYTPWLESGPYLMLIGLPLLGIGALCSGFVPGYPAWLRFDGGLLVGVALLCGVFTIRNWRVCFLQISTTDLKLRLVRGGPLSISRDQVASISALPKPNGRGGYWPLVEIAYHHDPSNALAKTVELGLQLTVEPINLLHALMAWKDADGDAAARLDRIERILRGQQSGPRPDAGRNIRP